MSRFGSGMSLGVRYRLMITIVLSRLKVAINSTNVMYITASIKTNVAIYTYICMWGAICRYCKAEND